MDLVLIAAAKFELDPLANALQSKGHNPSCKLVGIGSLNAAKSARSVADTCRGKDVIFVGTCGIFTGFTRVHLVRPAEVLWLPTSERMGFSYTVKDTAPPLSLPAPPAFARALPEKKVLCTPGISLVSKLPEGLQAEQCVENLELYSCIAEIAAQAASLAVILAVTNTVGADSHSEWRQHYTAAAGATAEFISTRVFKGA